MSVMANLRAVGAHLDIFGNFGEVFFVLINTLRCEILLLSTFFKQKLISDKIFYPWLLFPRFMKSALGATNPSLYKAAEPTLELPSGLLLERVLRGAQ